MPLRDKVNASSRSAITCRPGSAGKATRTSQRGFLRLFERGIAYRAEAPTLWDVDMKTAVAQAELEDREVPGAYHKLAFGLPGGGGPDGDVIWIDTTRPELLPACVALVAHPDDERYQPLFGQTAVTPLFGVEVPIVAHELAQPDKGTGIAMICTFGDTTDVTWWRELGLALRATIQRDGRLRPITWGEPGWESADPATAQAAYDELAGKTVKQAQARIVELLQAADLMEGDARPITHPVKFWENGSRPLEIVTSNQWFIRYPDKKDMIARGEQLNWWPDFMRVRYENWVNGLQGDWNITRQRFFGVPFPAWYPIDAEGNVVEGEGVGELFSRSPFLMNGYHDNPHATAACTTDAARCAADATVDLVVDTALVSIDRDEAFMAGMMKLNMPDARSPTPMPRVRKPSNRMTLPVARSIASPSGLRAATSIVVRSSSAEFIWLAIARFQINS